SGVPARWGTEVKVRKCCSASLGSGTARKRRSHLSCVAESLKPKMEAEYLNCSEPNCWDPNCEADLSVAAEGAAAFCAEPMVKKKSMVQRKTALSARFMKGPQVETAKAE